MSQEKALIHQEQFYFHELLPEYGKPQKFQESCNHKDPEEREG